MNRIVKMHDDVELKLDLFNALYYLNVIMDNPKLLEDSMYPATIRLFLKKFNKDDDSRKNA